MVTNARNWGAQALSWGSVVGQGSRAFGLGAQGYLPDIRVLDNRRGQGSS